MWAVRGSSTGSGSSCIPRAKPALIARFPHTQTHTNKHTHTHTHRRGFQHPWRFPSLSRTHTHACSHLFHDKTRGSLSLSHTHTHTHTRFPGDSGIRACDAEVLSWPMRQRSCRVFQNGRPDYGKERVLNDTTSLLSDNSTIACVISPMVSTVITCVLGGEALSFNVAQRCRLMCVYYC